MPTLPVQTTQHTIGQFVNAFSGGSRPNRFKVTVTGAGGGANGVNATLIPEHLVTATTLPSSVVGAINIPYRGRIYKFPGDRQYDDWSVMIYDDGEGANSIWYKWHAWSEQFNGHVNNIAKDRKQSPRFGSIAVHHLSHHDAGAKPIKTITLQNAWPVAVGAVNLDMAQANQLATFQCQIAFTHYTVSAP